ncbi:MAG: NCS2 family permease [Oligoflexia bacterium]|nr:NCS2 family permease [Oligoflexia bacterium]
MLFCKSNRELFTKPVIKREAVAALTTFFTAAYIIFVNPDILSLAGMDRSALIVVTCLAAAAGTIILGVVANVPYMMAPGMGLNAFFTYTIVIGRGVPWQTALGVVFISGLMFFILTILGVREKVILAIPKSLRLATPVGIGIFIAFIGLKNMGLVVSDEATLLTLGRFSPTVLIALAGLFIIAVLELLKVSGSIIIGIVVCTLIALLTGNVSLPQSYVSMPPSIAPLFMELNILDALQISLLSSLFAFMYVDLFDSLGTIMAVSSQAGVITEQNTIPRLGRILAVDAIATMIGAVLGTSTTTTYIESSSGVAAGGKSGLTAVFVGILFLLAIFFVPLISIVPSYATAPALVIVGFYMMREVKKIDFDHFDEAMPAFLTLILIPLTYSINVGIMFGFLSYFVIKVLLMKFSDINWVLVVITILSMVNLLVL